MVVFAIVLSTRADDKLLLLIAGKPSHGPGDHEFRAGCLLLKECLASVPGLRTEVHTNGWPVNDEVFADAAAVFIYADGGGNHPAIQENRIQLLDSLAAKGVGLGFGHYAVEVPAGDPGQAMTRWIGGYYEHQFSVNPMWSPHFTRFPDHPVARGVKPFQLLDEWYFNMRWAGDRTGLTPLLVASPSDDVRNGPYVYPRGPYPHIQQAKGRNETMMWAYERSDGGRGFGFTGGHKHVNWADDNVRKAVLNALLWIAKIEVPADGVPSRMAPEQLSQNLDPKGEPADASNLSGSWNFEVETQAGSGSPKFSLVHAGQNLIGQYEGFFGTSAVSGTVRDHRDVRIRFAVEQEGQEVPITYTGTIENPRRMKGTVRFGDTSEGTWTATR
jgi:hypothetical protein